MHRSLNFCEFVALFWRQFVTICQKHQTNKTKRKFNNAKQRRSRNINFPRLFGGTKLKFIDLKSWWRYGAVERPPSNKTIMFAMHPEKSIQFVSIYVLFLCFRHFCECSWTQKEFHHLQTKSSWLCCMCIAINYKISHANSKITS